MSKLLTVMGGQGWGGGKVTAGNERDFENVRVKTYSFFKQKWLG